MLSCLLCMALLWQVKAQVHGVRVWEVTVTKHRSFLQKEGAGNLVSATLIAGFH